MRFRPLCKAFALFMVMIVAAASLSCGCNGGAVMNNPPVVIGEELDQDGNWARRVIFEGSYRKVGWLPDPEGGHDVRVYSGRFILEIPNQRSRELTHVAAVVPRHIIMPGICEPVADTKLWVTAGYFEPNKDNASLVPEAGHHISVVVFDDVQVVHVRRLAVEPAKNAEHDFWFENGGHTLRYLASGGVGSYDVVANSTSGIVREPTD